MQLVVNKECIGHVNIVLLPNRSLSEGMASLTRGKFEVQLRLDIAKADILLRLRRLSVIVDLVYFSLHNNRTMLLLLLTLLLLPLLSLSASTPTHNRILQINTVLDHKPHNPFQTLHHELHLTIL